jgi:hypothetical protein
MRITPDTLVAEDTHVDKRSFVMLKKKMTAGMSGKGVRLKRPAKSCPSLCLFTVRELMFGRRKSDACGSFTSFFTLKRMKRRAERGERGK